jgi:hypothetical protein
LQIANFSLTNRCVFVSQSVLISGCTQNDEHIFFTTLFLQAIEREP